MFDRAEHWPVVRIVNVFAVIQAHKRVDLGSVLGIACIVDKSTRTRTKPSTFVKVSCIELDSDQILFFVLLFGASLLVTFFQEHSYIVIANTVVSSSIWWLVIARQQNAQNIICVLNLARSWVHLFRNIAKFVSLKVELILG